MSRIIAELAVQADTRELERAAKLFDEFSDAVKKGGKAGGEAYRQTLGSVDKLILRQKQLKNSLLNEKDATKVKAYATQLNAVSKQLDNISRKSANAKKSGIGENGTAALLGGLGGGVQGAFGAIGGAIGGGVGGAIGQQIGGVTEAMVDLGVESFKVAANYESILASVRLFAGEDSPALIKDIETFARENPIASLEKSMQAVSDLMGQGLNANEASQAIKGLTDIAGGNIERFQRLSYQLAQIKTRGKLTGDNLKDLAQSGFNPLEEIARKTGESMAQVQERMSKGGVVFEEVLGAINDATTGMGRFAGRSEAVSKTAAGALANLEDATTSFKIALGNFISDGGGSDFVLGLVEITRSATDMVNSLDRFDFPLQLCRCLIRGF